MTVLIVVLLMPVIILVTRIYLISVDSCWCKVSGKLTSMNVIKKKFGLFSDMIEDAPNNYIELTYEYVVNGNTYKGDRISLDLVARGYRPIEIEHDVFINKLKNGDLTVQYCKYMNNFSVIDRKTSHIASNCAMLFIYLTILLGSYILIIFI